VTLREAPPSSCTRSTKAIGPSAANVKDLRQDLRAVIKKCRPDWDITTPEFKKAWSEGPKDLFYPYGKTNAQTLGEQD
jgi:hypothetical protein